MPSTPIPLAVGSYQNADLRASCRRLVGCFSEAAPQTSMQDSKQPFYEVTWKPVSIRRFPGTTPFATDGTTNPVRGFRQMNGVMYVVIGPTLYSMSSSGALTQLGTGITGTGFVRIIDNKYCLFILVPGTSTGYVYTTANGFSQYTDSTFTGYGAIDCWFIDTYMVFLALDGYTFYNDDGQIASGTGPITFTTGETFTSEFGTDQFVGGTVDHREVFLLGQRTSEGYVDNGNAVGSPFSAAPDTYMEIGCDPDCAYSIANQDQSVFWIANDLTVRRRQGQTPQRVSNSGIENILTTLKKTGGLVGCYALTPSIAGHPFWVLNMPAAQRALAFDCLTSEWFELDSQGLGYWRPLCWYNALGKQFVGDSQAGNVHFLDTTSFTEFSNPITTYFVLQSVYAQHNRIAHRRLELMVTAAGAIKLSVSNDSGATWYDRETITFTPTTGEQPRAVWNNLGQSRDRAYMATITGNVESFMVDAELTGAGGVR